MSVRDSWQRTLVYFGLAEDREYFDEAPAPQRLEPEAEIEERYRDRPNVRRLSARRRSGDFDDIWAEEEPARRASVLRPVPAARTNGQRDDVRPRSDVRMHLVIPKSFNDAQQVADRFKDSIPVVLNLQAADAELTRRIIDFASGLTYALDGGMQRIADKVFMLTPRNVEISAEERAQLIEKGFFNQS
jgi:cell division inhibitor SepF